VSGGIERLVAAATLCLVLVGCAAPKAYDYTNFHARQPRSILVLPPLNNSTSIEGTYSYLSTVSQPLAELGYYVYPVAVVDQYLKENGMPTAGEMHQVSLAKVLEVVGADAVLYTTLEQYGSKFQLISTVATVQVKASLIDTRSQTVLWEGTALAQSGSGGSGNILGDIVAAAITQAINSKTDAAHGVCRVANAQLFYTAKHGIPFGPYSPKYKSN
jgi:hypothetical protein